MRSNYKKIGPYIRQVDARNVEDRKENLLGVSTQKVFIDSIANTIGTDFRTYKVVKRRQFTYVADTSRRGDRIGIALLEAHDEGLVSPIYTVFEIIDHDTLLPEYLMMWFRRTEFDRYARFKSHGSVRELFDWEEMCDVELPMPSIENQLEIVKEYHTIVDRIKLNERLNKKLEETAQAIYKQWFVDFEFPISAEYAAAVGKSEVEGLPYKSSGGVMVFNEVLKQEIPKGWDIGGIDFLVDLIDGDRGSNYPSQDGLLTSGYCLFLNTGNVTKNGFYFASNKFITMQQDKQLRKGKLVRGDVVLTTRGTVGNSAHYSDVIEYENVRINSGMIILRAKKERCTSLFVYYLLRSQVMLQAIDSFMSGSAQQHLPIKDIKNIPILLPGKEVIVTCTNHLSRIHRQWDLANKQIRLLSNLSDTLLRKISTI